MTLMSFLSANPNSSYSILTWTVQVGQYNLDLQKLYSDVMCINTINNSNFVLPSANKALYYSLYSIDSM